MVLNKYFEKDIVKFSICNKLIARGTRRSSSSIYANFKIANLGEYEATDIVGVSVNGARKERLTFDRNEIDKAIAVGVSFVLDNDRNCNRAFNIGEREIRRYLASRGYVKDYSSDFRSLWILNES